MSFERICVGVEKKLPEMSRPIRNQPLPQNNTPNPREQPTGSTVVTSGTLTSVGENSTVIN